MTEAETAPENDRLPWLGEEAEPGSDHRTRDAIGLAIVAALLIFGVSYWIASENWQRGRAEREVATGPQQAAPLPKVPEREYAARTSKHHPQAAAPAPQRLAQRGSVHPKQQVAANKAAPAPTARPTSTKPSKAATAVAENKPSKRRKAAAARTATEVASLPPRSSALSGGVVRIGGFASPADARLGWREMVRAYPALAHLSAVIVDASARGRAMYRFQIGTASEASSALLCQRMARINFSCGSVAVREARR